MAFDCFIQLVIIELLSFAGPLIIISASLFLHYSCIIIFASGGGLPHEELCPYEEFCLNTFHTDSSPLKKTSPLRVQNVWSSMNCSSMN